MYMCLCPFVHSHVTLSCTYVTGSVKTLANFENLKSHNSLTIPCNVVEIYILVNK